MLRGLKLRLLEPSLSKHARAWRERRRTRLTSVRVLVGRVPVGLTARHAGDVRDELARAGPDAPRFDGKRVFLRSTESMLSVAAAVERVRVAHPEYDADRHAWGLSRMQTACELVARGVGYREVARELRKRRRDFNEKALALDPPSRRSVFSWAAYLIFIVAFCTWALHKEIHDHPDKGATKVFIIAALFVILIPSVFVLLSGFMARTQMAEPWIPFFRFLDATRLSLSVTAGYAAYAYITSTHGGHGSNEYFRAAGELIALLAITIAVEARLSSPARQAVPFRGVLVLVGFAFVAYGEYTCLHVIAGSAPTRSEFAVVSGVLVGMGVAIALLAALGPMPFVRSPDSAPLRTPPQTKSRRREEHETT